MFVDNLPDPASSSLRLRKSSFAWAFFVILAASFPVRAQSTGASKSRREISHEILSQKDWNDVETAVDRGLAFLSKQLRPDGSYQQTPLNDPGISGLCVLAFLSRGHLPDQGPYGDKLTKSVDFIMNCQQQDGLLSKVRQSYHSPYNHGIAGLVLAELYGMSPPKEQIKQRKVIEQALHFTNQRFPQPKTMAHDRGSWRYLMSRKGSDGDLSITSWNIMFLRSAKNSGFDVDQKIIDEALDYMRRLYDPSRKTFRYEIKVEEPHLNHPRGMAGAGALSLSLAGEHHSEIAINAANFIRKQPFDQYMRPVAGEQYPVYGAFYCSVGMFHMGGEYWNDFYPQLVKTLLKAQRADGSWMVQQGKDVQYGAAYMTALTIVALTPPYQMLPIFQR